MIVCDIVISFSQEYYKPEEKSIHLTAEKLFYSTKVTMETCFCAVVVLLIFF